ncbi:MAG TPA: hypothetical protein VGC96_11790, partial [Candidatus Elarobacter sp.]
RFFDAQPYVVGKLGSLASGYAYSHSSAAFDASAVYGSQAPAQYSGAELVTLRLLTPPPSPEPSPRPRPPRATEVGAQAPLPLQPPPPPGPVVESGGANDPRLQLQVMHGYSGNAGTIDDNLGLALRWHVFKNSSPTYAGYRASSVDFFATSQNDQFRAVRAQPVWASSLFLGESAIVTTSRAAEESPYFFQVRESVGVQMNDQRFAPSVGSVTWLAPMSGPMAHLTFALARGAAARYYALDVFGFRETDTDGDFASHVGWQVTVPLLRSPGWLITAGHQTQIVSDRLAALEQGVVPNYGAAVTAVDTNAPLRPNAAFTRRAEKLDNILLQSPLEPLFGQRNVSAQFALGYDDGRVTNCIPAGQTAAKKAAFACGLVPTHDPVGGVNVQTGKLKFGVSDSPALGGDVASNPGRNVGTTGGLPGSVSAYFIYSGCPVISAAYANAAFPSGIPLPQQGSTVSVQADYPGRVGSVALNIGLGYFNERPAQNSGPAVAGAFIALRFGSQTAPLKSPCKL